MIISASDGGSRSAWTDERTLRLVALWGSGLSAAKIAEALGPGFSRNAVVGKLFRLGLGLSEERRHEAQAQGARDGQARRRRREGDPRSAPPMVPVGPEPETPCAVRPRLVELAALGPGGCRWPYAQPEGTRFCGHQARPDGSYCPDHHAIAYFAVLPPLTMEGLRALAPFEPGRAGARSAR